jgi:D-glycero-beta-D-manno-heptose 1-phosphate adenylyltransferase
MGKLDTIKSKILSGIQLERTLAYWRFKGLKIVFTNGCFDILHRGHADYLARASDLGDVLVVGLNSDRSVRSIKGSPRPLQDEVSRSMLLASFSFVSAVIIFDQDTPLELISHIRPDVLVKGKDYNPEDIAGYDVVTAKGGKVITLDMVAGYSTTEIVSKLTGGNTH